MDRQKGCCSPKADFQKKSKKFSFCWLEMEVYCAKKDEQRNWNNFCISNWTSCLFINFPQQGRAQEALQIVIFLINRFDLKTHETPPFSFFIFSSHRSQ